MVERPVELVNSRRSERVADLGSIERDPNHATVAGTVIGDVAELETGDGIPSLVVEDLRYCLGHRGSGLLVLAAFALDAAPFVAQPPVNRESPE